MGRRDASDVYESALAEVRVVIIRLGPIGLLASGAPNDEYDPGVTDLARLVMRSAPFGEEEVDEVWRRWFGDDYAALGSVELATQVEDLQRLQQRYSPTSGAGRTAGVIREVRLKGQVEQQMAPSVRQPLGEFAPA